MPKNKDAFRTDQIKYFTFPQECIDKQELCALLINF